MTPKYTYEGLPCRVVQTLDTGELLVEFMYIERYESYDEPSGEEWFGTGNFDVVNQIYDDVPAMRWDETYRSHVRLIDDTKKLQKELKDECSKLSQERASILKEIEASKATLAKFKGLEQIDMVLNQTWTHLIVWEKYDGPLMFGPDDKVDKVVFYENLKFKAKTKYGSALPELEWESGWTTKVKTKAERYSDWFDMVELFTCEEDAHAALLAWCMEHKDDRPVSAINALNRYNIPVPPEILEADRQNTLRQLHQSLHERERSLAEVQAKIAKLEASNG